MKKEIPKIYLYHCNTKEKCDNFLNNTLELIESNHKYDDNWLGKGMYYWDNLGNAKYWKKDKIRKNPSNKFVIIKSFVSLEKVLDLTDDDIVNIIEEVWKKLNIQDETNKDLKNKMPIGAKLDFIYEKISEIKTKYSIIKIIGINYKPKNNFFNEIKNNKIKPSSTVKVIYNVKDSTCIIKKGMIINE